jgi:hypothetical protein
VRDGALGGALIGRSLVHQWASSEAALREALKRRVARASALCASLECGRLPTATELATWIYGDGALQLGFAELLSEPVTAHREMLSAVRSHLAGLSEIRAGFHAADVIDDARAGIVSEIRGLHATDKILAFSQYAETVSMLFRRLSPSGRVALLTSHGARVAGGPITRHEAIHRFAPTANHRAAPRRAEVIDLLLTTDLLSEGVNLQDAGVVIHLDIPWTPARMEQRVGRAARLGSAHARVDVHILRPPGSADKAMAGAAIIERKWRIASATVGTGGRSPLASNSFSSESAPAKAERLRAMLAAWVTEQEQRLDACPVASVRTETAGFIAVVSTAALHILLVAERDAVSSELDDQLRICALAQAAEFPTTLDERDRAVAAILEWHDRERAMRAAGMGASTVVRRRRLTARIDEAIQSALPHQRTRRSALAARARRVVTSQQCAAVESELEQLLHSPTSIDHWLEAVAALESADQSVVAPPSETDIPRIHALLLLGRSA